MSVQGTLGVRNFEPNENKVKEAVVAYIRGKFGGVSQSQPSGPLSLPGVDWSFSFSLPLNRKKIRPS